MEERGLNEQRIERRWVLCVYVRTCGRWYVCWALCLCVVIYSSINNLTWFLSFEVQAPQGLRLDCFLLRFIILIILLQLFRSPPPGSLETCV